MRRVESQGSCFDQVLLTVLCRRPNHGLGGLAGAPPPQKPLSLEGGTLQTDLGNGMNEWMQTAFADHLDSARCSALITEEDLAAGIVALGGSLALLQVDLAKLADHHDCLLTKQPLAG